MKMNKRSYFWMALGMAFLLLLPICSTAQTQMKLNLMTKDGDYITTTQPIIKSFFMGGDQNLFVLVDQPILFTSPNPIIDISNLSPNCSNPGDGSLVVTYSQGGTFSFRVSSPTPGVILSAPYRPGGAFDQSTGIYTSWAMASEDIGNFFLVFQGDSSPNISQRVVMLKIVPPGYTLTVNVSGTGSVTKNPDKTAYTINPVETVTLTANPGSGYYFSGWTGDLSGGTNPTTITMNGNKTVTATFTQTPSYTLTSSVTPAGAGSISLSPAGGVYNANQVVTVTATPTPGSGYSFSYWGGDLSGSANPATITMNGNKTINANFSTGWVIPPGAIPLDTYYPYWGNYFGKDQQMVAQGETKYYTINLTAAQSSLVLNTWTLSGYKGAVEYKVYNPNGKLIGTPQNYGEEISLSLYFNYQFCDSAGMLQTYNSPTVQPEGLIPGLYLVEAKYVSGCPPAGESCPYFRIGWKSTEPATPACLPPGR